MLSSLEVHGGYKKVKAAASEGKKTAFMSYHKIFRLIRMPFGLKNATFNFQSANERDVIVWAVAECASSPEQYCQIFQLSKRAHRLRSQGISLTEKCRGDIWAKQMQLLC